MKDCADEIYGLDIHPFYGAVTESMNKIGVSANLVKGDLLNTPYEHEFFDALFCISTLEHLSPMDLDRAMNEFDRIMKKGGQLFIGVPAKNKLTETFFEKLCKVKQAAGEMHKSSHYDVLESVRRKFVVEKVSTFPSRLPLFASFYIMIKARKS